MSAYYQNVRGLKSKLRTLTCNIPLTNFDIYLFSETWLNDSINSSELGFNNFNVFRLDRNKNNSSNKHGGGVLIAVKKQIACKSINLSKNNLETLFLILKLGNKKIIVNCSYIPPDSPITIYQDFVNILQDIVLKNSKAHFLICGDFNLPKVPWDKISDYSNLVTDNNLNAKAEVIRSALLFHSFKQYNSLKTHLIIY